MDIEEHRQNALKRVINDGMTRAAVSLSRMTDAEVVVEAPRILVLSAEELDIYGQDRCSLDFDIVRLDFGGGFHGSAGLILTRDSGDNLAGILARRMGAGGPDEDMRADILREVGNVALIAVTGAAATALSRTLTYSPLSHGTCLTALLESREGQKRAALCITTCFRLDEACVSGEILLLLHFNDFAALLEALDRLA